MYSSAPKPFSASTSKLAYAQAFSGGHRRRTAGRPSLLARLAARRTRHHAA